jgi:starvation-inducible DNA-binding protein
MNYLGISKEKLTPVVEGLNEILASYQIYYQNLRSFHWHVEGQNFFELHNIFEGLYNDAKVKIDEIAERILTLRFYPKGNLSDYLHLSSIPEAGNIIEDEQMVMTILENHHRLINQLRDVINKSSDVNDEGTVDLLAGILGNLEKKSWMLDAWTSKRFAREQVLA